MTDSNPDSVPANAVPSNETTSGGPYSLSPLTGLFQRLRGGPSRKTTGAFGGKRKSNGIKLTKDWRQTRTGQIGEWKYNPAPSR